MRHGPKPLSETPPAGSVALVEAAAQDRLIIYLGAGVSIAPPADGPRGSEVADELRPVVAEMLGVEVDELAGLALEELTGRVAEEAADRLDRLKARAAETWGFREMEPNYGHGVVALLLREGVVRVVSANWDCGVENAGERVEVTIQGVSRQQDIPLPIGTLPLYKIHGCARRPETLVLTREEVDGPECWARAEVEQALTGGIVVFVGLGTLGTYVSEPLEELAKRWVDHRDTSVRVVDCDGLSDGWAEILSEAHGDVASIDQAADEFFDDLLRAVVLEALSSARQLARRIDEVEGAPWSREMLDGIDSLRRRLLDSPADAALRWWRDGVSRSEHGRPFVFAEAGKEALLCIAQLATRDGGDVTVAGQEGRLTVRSERRYFEVAYQSGQHWSRVTRAAQARLERRRRDGCYVAGTPATVVIPRATGALPDASAHGDVASEGPSASNIAAGTGEGIAFVRAEDALSGRLAA